MEESTSNVQLADAIHSFKNLIKNEGQHFAKSMMENLRYEVSGDLIKITLTNTRDSRQFDEMKSRFLEFVNKETGNKYTLEVQVTKLENKVDTIYTNKDKLKYLAEKHPFLIEFAKGLDLDIE